MSQPVKLRTFDNVVLGSASQNSFVCLTASRYWDCAEPGYFSCINYIRPSSMDSCAIVSILDLYLLNALHVVDGSINIMFPLAVLSNSRESLKLFHEFLELWLAVE